MYTSLELFDISMSIEQVLPGILLACFRPRTEIRANNLLFHVASSRIFLVPVYTAPIGSRTERKIPL